MFVKWQSRKSSKNPNITARYYTYLVESHREGNKVKQKVVRYLGSIAGHKKWNGRKEVAGEEFYPIPVKLFYEKAQKNLDKPNISKKERKKILKSLSLKIPHPSPKEIKQVNAEYKAWLEEFKTL